MPTRVAAPSWRSARRSSGASDSRTRHGDREIRCIDVSDVETRRGQVDEIWAAATDIGFFRNFSGT